ncbi:hypothetical protein LX36DRAFT_607924 [Colletotrichum falcatum]|nr:hypothetical protein LX36DRAFT_607924 [Colletotrichum falcatum]
MHSQYLVLGLLGRAVLLAAAPIGPAEAVERRDNLATIETALAPVIQSLSAVDLAVNSLDGTTVSVNKLLAASEEAQTSVDKATIIVRAAGDLSVSHSLKLRKTTDTLATQTKTTLDDLVSHKAVLDQLGFSAAALVSLQQQEASSMALSDALVDKVPKIGQSEAASDKSNMEAMFDSAIAAYSVAEPPVVPVPVPVPAPVVPVTPVPAPVVPVTPVPAPVVPVTPVPAPVVPVTPVPAPVVPVTPVPPVVPVPPAPIIVASKDAKGDKPDVDAPVEHQS